MGMFTNYDMNSTTCPLKEPKEQYCNNVPYAEYNAEGELVGYYWYYGDTVNLQFNVSGEVTVDKSSIIYDIHGQTPDENTVGEIDQRAYNLIDLISWACTAISGDIYTWTQDEEFTYPTDGDKLYYITAKELLKQMTAKVCLYNFRYELIQTFNAVGSNLITVSIDKELSDKLIKGIYYITLTMTDDKSNTYIPVIRDKECVINVK